MDSVYQHVLAWQEALECCGMPISVWRMHRRIGISGGLFANALLQETGREVTAHEAARPARLRQLHAEAYAERARSVSPLPGAHELLGYLSAQGVPWAIATSGYRESAAPVLELLKVPDHVPVITRDQVRRAKPDPDLFRAAAERLGVGLLSGGYGAEELARVGAYRVYEDPADLLRRLDEVGVRAAV